MEKAYYPRNLEEALDILEAKRPKVIAGGTDVMLEGKQYEEVMFIGGLSCLKGIERCGGILKVGAGVTLTELSKSGETEFLREVIGSIASPGIRNWATIGGNICNASPIGDLLPVLYAMDGKVVIAGRGRRRRVEIEEFIVDRKKVALGADEMVEGIELQIPCEGSGRLWLKVAGREANALSKVGLFVVYTFEESLLKEVRLAIGGLSPRVIRSKEAEKLMVEGYNGGLGREEIKGIFEEYRDLMKPIDDQRSTARYKAKVAERIYGEVVDELMEYRY